MFHRVLVLVWSLCCWEALAVREDSAELYSLRLAKGDHRCRGTLEVLLFVRGRHMTWEYKWIRVAPWDIPEWFGDRICVELGCGSALTVKKKSLSSRDTVYFFPDRCVDAELFHCFDSEIDSNYNSVTLSCSGALAVNEASAEPYSLRLVEGDGRCRGLLEILRTGEDWTAVDSQSVPLWFGDRVCAELDCGSALTVDWKRVSHRETVLVFPYDCGTSLIDCFSLQTRGSKNMLELNCSDSVRLVEGRSLCSGSLQIRDRSLNQSWTSVCEGALGHRGAEVLCRELGCGAPLLQGKLSPLGQTFHCEGHESALMDCPRNQTRTDLGTCSGPTLNLTCSDLRLVGGANRCEGLVELTYRGEWRQAWGHWDLKSATAVCRELDCGSVVSTETQHINMSDVWRITAYWAKQGKAAVRDCVYDGYSRSDIGLEVVCSDSVRLVEGRSLCSGSLQIQDRALNQSWTSVCEGALDRRGAEVLCRELDCGAPVLQGELSPLGQTFHCEGNESALMDCPRNQTGTDPGTCFGPTLNLTCSDTVRLVGGSSRCEGTVELKYRGQWRRVFTHTGPWHLEAAAAVCRSVDCGFVVSTDKRRDFNRSDVWLIEFGCVEETRAAVRDCVRRGGRGYTGGLEVVCSDSVRLVEGRSPCSGSLQIRNQSQSWTSVCEGALDRRGAEVLCRELGCGVPLLQGELSPQGQTFHCEGNESALMDCPQNQTRTDTGTCSGPTLHLTCSDLRLVGGASRCEGTLELKYKGEWKRALTYLPHWDLETAAVMCRHLDCGSYVSTEKREGFYEGQVWHVKAACLKTKAAVRDCVPHFVSGTHYDLGMVCSGKV